MTPSRTGADFALQDEPRGTGDAVRAALAAVPDDATEILVLYGDVPLVTGADSRPSSRRAALDDAAIALRERRRRRSRPSSAGSSAARPARSSAIVEAKDATDDELASNEINAGLYAFDAAWLRRRIDVARAVGRDRRALPDRPRRARPRRRPARRRARCSRTTAGSSGSTTAPSWPRPSGTCGSGSTRRHMRAGVTMRDPSTVYLDATSSSAPT